MSLLQSYQRNLERKQKELLQLQQAKSRESQQYARSVGKVEKLRKSINQTSNLSSKRSKENQLSRLLQEQGKLTKKIAEIDKKIVKKQKEVFNEEEKIQKEQKKIQLRSQRRNREQSASFQRDLNEMGNSLRYFANKQEEIMNKVRDIQNLPSSIVVLFLAANPIDQNQLRLDREAREISDSLRKTKHRDSIRLETRWAVRTQDILQAINELEPTIIHFSGHGSNSDDIIFEDNLGNAKAVKKDAVVQLMLATSATIRLVMFNTCYSRNQAESVVQHVESAIGMNTTIGDLAATTFASQLYSAIGFGKSLKESFEQAKVLIMMDGLESDVPELFIKIGCSAEEIYFVEE